PGARRRRDTMTCLQVEMLNLVMERRVLEPEQLRRLFLIPFGYFEGALDQLDLNPPHLSPKVNPLTDIQLVKTTKTFALLVLGS
ncbi:MAG: hypothetical protein ABI977_27985, partial [Acidobacteriota bacterium]